MRRARYRHVVLPAALPAFVAGLKQGWAFAWRSLLAGELLVIIANVQSLGVRLHFARELSDAPGLMASTSWCSAPWSAASASAAASPPGRAGRGC